MINKIYPSRKLIERLLLEHRDSAWKINQKIPYKQFIPHSKNFINNWINNHIFYSPKLMLQETIKSMSSPKILESRYKNFHPDLWSILDDPTIRELVELDFLFGISANDVCDRLNVRIKPRKVNALAIKQFNYYFWNLNDKNGIFRPAITIDFIQSNRELSGAYSHVLKYFNKMNGKEIYEYQYSLNNPEEPDLKNINKVINLTTFAQIEALRNDNIDKVDALSEILLKNVGVYKILKTIPNSTEIKDLSEILGLKDD